MGQLASSFARTCKLVPSSFSVSTSAKYLHALRLSTSMKFLPVFSSVNTCRSLRVSRHAAHTQCTS